MPAEDRYSEVSLTEGTRPHRQDSPVGESILRTKVKRVGWWVFPWVSLATYLGDVVTSFSYAIVLFKYADEGYVAQKGLNFRWWGSLIILVHLFSGILINVVATFDR